MYTQRQKTLIVDAVLCLVALMVVLQLWLLTASMNAYLGGDEQVLIPAALVSGALLGLNLGLLAMLERMQRR